MTGNIKKSAFGHSVSVSEVKGVNSSVLDPEQRISSCFVGLSDWMGTNPRICQVEWKVQAKRDLMRVQGVQASGVGGPGGCDLVENRDVVARS